MAKQIKVPWNVYIQRQVICEDPEKNDDNFSHIFEQILGGRK